MIALTALKALAATATGRFRGLHASLKDCSWPVSDFVNSTLRGQTVFPKLTSQPRFLIPWARRRSVVFESVNIRCRRMQMLGNRYCCTPTR
jgi:hypothetical protein